MATEIEHPEPAAELLPPETSSPFHQAGELLPIDPAAPWKAVFEVWARGGGHSPHTIRAYRRHLERFFSWAPVHSPAQITPAMLAAWRGELESRASSTSHLAQAVAALRTLVKFCRAFPGGKHLPDSDALAVVFRSPKVSRQRPPQILHQEEIDELLETTGAERWEYVDSIGRRRSWKRSPEVRERDHALIRFMLGTGARVAEVVALKVSDLSERPSGGIDAYIARGKGSKDRTVYAPADASDALRRYLHATGRGLGGDGWLFPSPTDPDGGPLTTRAVEKLVERLMERAGIYGKRITPHSLRHTFADRFLRATDGDIVRLQEILGHSDISTTRRYLTRIRGEEVAERVPVVSEVV